MESAPLINFGLAVVLATFLGVVAKFLGQPTLLAYLASGTILAFLGEKSHFFIADFSFLPEIGLVLLLFLVGMELDVRRLTRMGKPIIMASLGQIVISTLLAMWISRGLGFGDLESFYLGLAIAFSSTIVVVKLFTDRQEMDSLHGRLALGILLVEDLVAVFVLMFLSLSKSGLSLGVTETAPILSLLTKAALLVALMMMLARYGFPKLLEYVASSVELLFLSAVAICFAAVGLFSWAGFSREIGAFVAGVALGNSDFRVQIAARIKPLRDLFVAIFFIELGILLGHHMDEINLLGITIFVLYALLIKPLIFVTILTLSKFRWHTVFQTSVGLSQVSEFSLIVMSLALLQNQVTPASLSLIAFVTIGTMAVSSFSITHSGMIYKKLGRYLKFLSPRNIEAEEIDEKFNDHVILIGCDRSGRAVVEFLAKKKKQVVVIDFNPEVVDKLKNKGVDVVFGDAADPEVIESVRPERADIIISTLRDFEDNISILDTLKKMGVKTHIVMAAMDEKEKRRLSRLGAHEVVVPLALESESIIEIIKDKVKRYGRV